MSLLIAFSDAIMQRYFKFLSVPVSTDLAEDDEVLADDKSPGLNELAGSEPSLLHSLE